jgi:hypothetical protein
MDNMFERKCYGKHVTIPQLSKLDFEGFYEENTKNFSFSEENTEHFSKTHLSVNPFNPCEFSVTPKFSTQTTFEKESTKKSDEIFLENIEEAVAEENHAKKVKVKPCVNTEKINVFSCESSLHVNLATLSLTQDEFCLKRNCQNKNATCGCSLF